MKKQLSLLLLTLSISSINMLPGQAAVKVTSSNVETNVVEGNLEEQALINGDKWCAEVPWMGLFCYLF